MLKWLINLFLKKISHWLFISGVEAISHGVCESVFFSMFLFLATRYIIVVSITNIVQFFWQGRPLS